MINSGTNTNGEANVKNGKKIALRDLQNQENSIYFGEKNVADTIKSCGTKRLTPEGPSNSLVNNGVNEQILNVRRRFELEFGKTRLNNNVSRFSDLLQSQHSYTVSHKKSDVKESSTSQIPPPVPNLLVNSSNTKIQVAESVCSKTNDEQQREERFVRLQKYLKKCDDTYQKDYVQVLLRLTPGELSRHAVELEKRAMQINMDEAKEIQQMKMLNILGNSVQGDKLLQSPQVNKAGN